jgi:hypothetical protein
MRKFLFLLIVVTFSIITNAQGWSVLTTNSTSNLKGIHFPTETTGYAVGDNGTILKTTNGGAQWTSQTTSYPGYWFWDVHFIDENTGYVVGESDPGFNPCGQGIILKTTNGGTNWTTLASSLSYPVRDLFVLSKDTLFICGGAEQTSSVIAKSFDGGNTFTPIGTSYFDAMLGGLFFLNSNIGFLGVYESVFGSYNPTLATWLSTSSGGSSFSSNVIPSSSSYWNFASDFPDALNGYFTRSTYVTGWPVYLRKTTDGGASWNENLISSFTGGLYGLDFIDANTGYIVGEGGVIQKTINGGSTWNTEISPTTSELRSVCFVNPTLGFAAGANGTILKYVVYTGIPKIEASCLSVDVYPVPASNKITLECTALPEDISISVYNIHGQLVLQSDIYALKTEIDISSLAYGVYLLKFLTSDETVIKKFIKE